MNIIEFLQTRKSVPAKFLTEPAPSEDDLSHMLQAAMAAADHGMLKPWRFIVIQGNARYKLGELLANASQTREPSLTEDRIQKQRDKPLRSPTIVAVVANITKNNSKVP